MVDADNVSDIGSGKPSAKVEDAKVPLIPPEDIPELLTYANRIIEVLALLMKAQKAMGEVRLPPNQRSQAIINGITRALTEDEYKDHATECLAAAGVIFVGMVQQIMFETAKELQNNGEPGQDERFTFSGG